MERGGRHRRRQTAAKRNRDGAGATHYSALCQRIPARRARPVARGSGETPIEGASVRDSICRRCHFVLSAQGGRGKGAECPTEAVREIRSDTAPGEDAADRIRALCSGEREETGEETQDLQLPWFYAYVRPQPEGEVHSAREDDSQAAPQGADGGRRLVQTAPARSCERAAENPKRQAPRSLPVLRTTDELPKHLAVLSEGPPYLVRMAESSHTRATADVGEICGNPAPASVVATSDHTGLGGNGESRLKNPLRKICTAGSVRGEILTSHGGLNRARNWKRWKQPKKTYSSTRSPLLGERFRFDPQSVAHPERSLFEQFTECRKGFSGISEH